MLYLLFKRAIETNNTVWSKDLLRLQIEVAYNLHGALEEVEYAELVGLLTPTEATTEEPIE